MSPSFDEENPSRTQANSTALQPEGTALPLRCSGSCTRSRTESRRPRFCGTLTTATALACRLGYFSLPCVSQSAAHRLQHLWRGILDRLGGPRAAGGSVRPLNSPEPMGTRGYQMECAMRVGGGVNSRVMWCEFTMSSRQAAGHRRPDMYSGHNRRVGPRGARHSLQKGRDRTTPRTPAKAYPFKG